LLNGVHVLVINMDHLKGKFDFFPVFVASCDDIEVLLGDNSIELGLVRSSPIASVKHTCLSKCQTSPLFSGVWVMTPVTGSGLYHSAMAESLGECPTSRILALPS
jgi:hypothetical protein